MHISSRLMRRNGRVPRQELNTSLAKAVGERGIERSFPKVS
jgi:hypothetical protein